MALCNAGGQSLGSARASSVGSDHCFFVAVTSKQTVLMTDERPLFDFST